MSRRPPRWILRPDNIVVERDTAEHEEWLALHGETKGGAYVFSRDGERANAVTAPKVFFELGAPCGCIESFNHITRQRERAVVYPVTGPGFIFDEKGLRDAALA